MKLTREQIEAMQPGKELDELVGINVMGWTNKWNNFSGTNDWIGSKLKNDRNWNPSTDISAAWEVVEKMRPTYVYELADFGRNAHKNHGHYAAFHPITKPRDYERQVRAKTLTEAICKAALLAIGGEQDV